jgi:hypothetical protein
MPKKTSGVKPPLIGKLTGRLRTPLSIMAGFFVLGVICDLILEFIARHAEALQKRVHVGFQFWALGPEWTYTLPDGTQVDARETIAYDDLILIIISFAILFIYKIGFKKRAYAFIGFFGGWYASSMWISPRIPWQAPPSNGDNQEEF